MAEHFTADDLKTLPVRSVLMLASRVLWRLQPLISEVGEAVDKTTARALQVADQFAGSETDINSLARKTAEVMEAVNHDWPKFNPVTQAGALNGLTAAILTGIANVLGATQKAAMGRVDEVLLPVWGALNTALIATPDQGLMVRAARLDFERLRSIAGGSYPELGGPVHPGDLGPLWPEGKPSWGSDGRTLHVEARSGMEAQSATTSFGAVASDAERRGGEKPRESASPESEMPPQSMISQPQPQQRFPHGTTIVDPIVPTESSSEEVNPAPPISLYFDLEEFDRDDIVELLSLLSDLYRSVGGDALVIERMGLLEPSLIPEPAGV